MIFSGGDSSCGFRLFSILFVSLLSAGRQQVKIQTNRRIQTDQILLQCLLNIYILLPTCILL